MKTLLFNYCLEKFLNYVGELYQESDRDVQMIALSLSNSRLFRRYPSGCNVEPLCFCDTYYAHDLFLAVCADAIENGDDIRKYFQFVLKRNEFDNIRPRESVEEITLVEYSRSFYKQAGKPDYAMYSRLLKKDVTKENLLELFSQKGNVKTVSGLKLEMPEPCEATEMIDRAWDRLMKRKTFKNLFSIEGKHEIYGNSAAYNFYKRKLKKLVG